MLTICKKEIRGYLTSMTGYVFIAFVLLLAGIYFTVYHMLQGYPIFGATLSSMTFIFLIITPILTMRALAEEQKAKTDQLLFTSPLSIEDIVIGKYLGMAAVFGITVLILCLYPLIMSAYGEVSMPMAYTSLFGFFLLGSASISVGLFLSSITESPVIAAVLTFGVLFVSYLIDGINSMLGQTASTSVLIFAILILGAALLIYGVVKNTLLAFLIGILGEAALMIVYFVKASWLEGAIQSFLNIFNLTSHFDDFTNGILSLSHVIYYITVIGVCLFLTIQSVQKRRWS